MKKVLYIEDDLDIAEYVKTYLERKNFIVQIYSDINIAKEIVKSNIPDVCLIDINLSNESGRDLCVWLRKNYSELPIIFITVKNETQDIVEGFEIGADDYITKPFELEILNSRIKALLRRNKNTNGLYTCKDILLDETKVKVFVKGKEIALSHIEYDLLLILIKNKNATVTRKKLLQMLWDNNGNFVNDNTLTVTVKRLREKLENPNYLKTVYSFGYRLEDRG